MNGDSYVDRPCWGTGLEYGCTQSAPDSLVLHIGSANLSFRTIFPGHCFPRALANADSWTADVCHVHRHRQTEVFC